MTQYQFDFAPKPDAAQQEIQKWMDQHNQQVQVAAREPSQAPGSLVGALDTTEAKANAVYLLRGILGQQVRKSLSSGAHASRYAFLQALRAEVSVKKTAQNPAVILRNILIKTLSVR